MRRREIREGENLEKAEINLINTIVYAGRMKDKELLLSSSSGGAFTVLSDWFLKNGNAVVATSYNYKTHTEEFKLIQTKVERDVAKGSKYVQSKPGTVFRTAEAWLKQNPEKSLLFVSIGCQAEGFRKFAEIKGFRDPTYIVDIICHGSPSPKLWREYAGILERKHSGKISYLTFKDKRNGWKAPMAFAVINGQEVPIKDYVKIFYNRCALRPSCHVCPFATTERKTDITIEDFWHIEDTIPDFYDENGTSLFLIHTERGLDLFENIKDKLQYRPSNTEQCWQVNLERPTAVSEERGQFWADYHNKGIDFIMKKYGTTPLKTKVKNKLLKIFGRRGYELSYILCSEGGEIENSASVDRSCANKACADYVSFSERRAA